MALVKCPDCGKSISDKAVSCNACGCPLGGGSSSVGNAAFEERIEEYKKSGYVLKKRDGNTVKMEKFSLKAGIIILVVWAVLSIVVAFIGGGTIAYISVWVLAMVFAISIRIGSAVNISITKTNKIEEVGNVLKKK